MTVDRTTTAAAVTSKEAWMAELGGDARTEVLFVDPRVADYQSLIAGARSGVEVVVLDAGQDGFAQIASYLEGRSGVQALHILSHGSAGSLQLGSGGIDGTTLQANATLLARIGGALTEDADILLYGCDVAAGETGVSFISTLAEMTGADVAASDDTTGAANLGGDWVLEASHGDVSTSISFSAHATNLYSFVLPTIFTFEPGDGTVTGDGTQTGNYDLNGGTVYRLNTNTTVDVVAYVGGEGSGASTGLVLGSAKEESAAFTITNTAENITYTFDLSSIHFRNTLAGQSQTFVVTTSKGGVDSITILQSANNTLNLAGAQFTGISSFTITSTSDYDPGGNPDYQTVIDNVTVDNITPPDATPPTVASIVRQTPSTSPTNADSLTWRVTFSEAIDPASISAADFSVTGTTATVTSVTPGGGNTYVDVEVSGGNLAGLDGAVTLSFAGGYSIDDAAGNAMVSTAVSGTNNNSFTVDNTAPAAPGTPDLDAADDTGASDSDNLTKNTSGLTFTGTGVNGETVELFRDANSNNAFDGGESLGTATVAGGNYSIDASLAAGTHSIRAVQKDAAG
ncbi:MAG TPA: DUF4347 domain-containing protein, partial [Azospirillaceae bacterium]|nr:DUF4347 domain-containing protein [Azospirillaceae bacterium]